MTEIRRGPEEAGPRVEGCLFDRGRETDADLARRTTDAVLDSVADLPGWLGIS